MAKYDSYFICTTRDGNIHYFYQRCNNVDIGFDGKMIIFKEKKELNHVTLAIIPIDYIASIDQVNAPEL